MSSHIASISAAADRFNDVLDIECVPLLSPTSIANWVTCFITSKGSAVPTKEAASATISSTPVALAETAAVPIPAPARKPSFTLAEPVLEREMLWSEPVFTDVINRRVLLSTAEHVISDKATPVLERAALVISVAT